jgi:hypothetical protein
MIDSRNAADEMHSVRITGPVQTGGGGGFTTDDDRQPAL